ncbi:hypothetical protein [Cupriavidus sp. TMH.W2]|uniref:hypothetical protein n=1 Tax=Cupriavidus sp. TMH.W2 TaxID=3434465 RepID=UPI003D787BD3
MKTKLTKRDYLTASAYALWRFFQMLVVIPASLVGALLLAMALSGQSPIESTVIGVFHWAETSVRPAPAGTVLVTQCKDQKSDGIKPPMLCESWSNKTIPFADAAREVRGSLTNLYLVTVLLSAFAMFFVRPGRRFFGLKEVANA